MKYKDDIIWLKETDSTNSEARRRICSLANMSVVSAVWQTAGRGQGDHTWSSCPGENLTFTLVLKFGSEGLPTLKISDSILLPQMITGGIRRYLESMGIDTVVKWPNDIWTSGRKICGMLIENILNQSDIQTCFVGIGLNINQLEFPPHLPNPVSVRQLTGALKPYDLKRELRRLLDFLHSSIEQAFDPEGREALAGYFEKNMLRLD